VEGEEEEEEEEEKEEASSTQTPEPFTAWTFHYAWRKPGDLNNTHTKGPSPPSAHGPCLPAPPCCLSHRIVTLHSPLADPSPPLH